MEGMGERKRNGEGALADAMIHQSSGQKGVKTARERRSFWAGDQSRTTKEVTSPGGRVRPWKPLQKGGKLLPPSKKMEGGKG